MRYLATGSSGFIGGHLLANLLGEGHEVHALDPAVSSWPMPDGLVLHQGRIDDPAFVKKVVTELKPEVVFHLAAQSYPGVSWERPVDTFKINLEGTVNLLDACRAVCAEAKILITCSSAEYAPGEEGRPIAETAALAPSSPYGISKLAQDYLCELYARRYGIHTIRMRPFFITGPGKVGDVSSDFARRVVAAERGEADIFPVGNLEIVRDFLDVRDAVMAFRLLEDKGVPGEVYNICSGNGYRIGDILEAYRELSSVLLNDQVDSSLLRPVDEMVKIGDPGKLKSLGWSPTISFKESLASILNYWRER